MREQSHVVSLCRLQCVWCLQRCCTQAEVLMAVIYWWAVCFIAVTYLRPRRLSDIIADAGKWSLAVYHYSVVCQWCNWSL